MTDVSATQNSDLTKKIIGLVSTATKIEENKIHLTTSFVNDLNLDSLDTVELMMQMEEEFDIEIPEEDAAKLQTVKDVVTYINSKQN